MPEPGQMPGSYADADPQSGIVASELCGGRISTIYKERMELSHVFWAAAGVESSRVGQTRSR